jgi:hypothetical protein
LLVAASLQRLAALYLSKEEPFADQLAGNGQQPGQAANGLHI